MCVGVGRRSESVNNIIVGLLYTYLFLLRVHGICKVSIYMIDTNKQAQVQINPNEFLSAKDLLFSHSLEIHEGITLDICGPEV